MKKRTLEALKLSIAHWERMATGNQFLEEKPEGDWCSLCITFNDDLCMGVDCTLEEKDAPPESCPASIATGKCNCFGTPYYKALHEWQAREFSMEFCRLAILELEFLQSLLPKED